jgi:hypothetical protein
VDTARVPLTTTRGGRMARIPRLTIAGEPTVYHVISRTTLDGFVLGDVEKEYLLAFIQRLSGVYFTEVLGFCLMGNHFHLLVRMHLETEFSDDEIWTRFQRYYHAGSNRKLTDGQIPPCGPNGPVCPTTSKRLNKTSRAGTTNAMAGKVSSGASGSRVCWWSDRKTTAGARLPTTCRRATRMPSFPSTLG